MAEVESMEVTVVAHLDDGTQRKIYLPSVHEGGMSVKDNYLMIFGKVTARGTVE